MSLTKVVTYITLHWRLSLAIWASLVVTSCGGGGGATSAPQLKITTASLPNGTSLVAYSQTIQAIGGVAPFSWSVNGAMPHNLTLAPSAANMATISGTPDTPAQGVAFTVRVTDSMGETASQAYTISVLLEPDTVTLAPASISFAPQPTGTSSSAKTESIANTGSSPVVISSITLGGTDAADFSQTNSCGSTLAGGTTCTISLAFSPAQIGPRIASLTINDNTLGTPHSLALNGVGLTSGVNATLSANALTFASLIATTTDPQTITLGNYGTATLNTPNLALTGAFAETDNCSGALAPGATCSINVTFTPVASGSASGTLTITDNAPDSPQTVSLTGTGVAGKCVPQGQQCSSTAPCCAGLQCVFNGGSTRVGYVCK